jgi:Domain of unknown function (DUF3870)
MHFWGRKRKNTNIDREDERFELFNVGQRPSGTILMMRSKDQQIILGGQARLPKELFSEETLQVVVELNPAKNEVIAVACTPSLPVIEDWLRQLMIGMNIETGIHDLRKTIENRLHHKSKKSVLAAITDLARVYDEYRSGGPAPQSRRLDGLKW